MESKKPVCHVVGAGDFHPSLFCHRKVGDLVIAADAGLCHLEKMGIRPDLFVGDTDSLKKKPEGIPSVFLPSVKDDTDTLAAVRLGIERGFETFYLYGALGGKRFSHSLANLQILSFLADQGLKGVILDPAATLLLLTQGTHSLVCLGGYFSLFAMEGEAEVSVSGAKYPLEHALLTPGFPLGVSNEGEKNTEILVHKGRVLFVREKASL